MVYVDPDKMARENQCRPASFGIIYKIEDGKCLILVLRCVCKGRDNRGIPTGGIKEYLQLPGGTCQAGESPLTGMVREVSAEITHDATPISLKYQSEVYQHQRPGDVYKGGGVHTQHFYLLNINLEQLRLREIDREESDGDTLKPPQWMEVEELYNDRFFQKKRSHCQAVLNALHTLVQDARYGRLIGPKYEQFLEYNSADVQWRR